MQESPHDLASQVHGPRLQRSTLRQRFSSLILLTFAFALFVLPDVLHAQGCAMCYTSADAARSGAKAALANGVLILLVPPMVFFALFIVVVYKYRNKFRDLSVIERSGGREAGELSEPPADVVIHPIIGSPDHPIYPFRAR